MSAPLPSRLEVAQAGARVVAWLEGMPGGAPLPDIRMCAEAAMRRAGPLRLSYDAGRLAVEGSPFGVEL